jgi:hypothetical protein
MMRASHRELELFAAAAGPEGKALQKHVCNLVHICQTTYERFAPRARDKSPSRAPCARHCTVSSMDHSWNVSFSTSTAQAVFEAYERLASLRFPLPQPSQFVAVVALDVRHKFAESGADLLVLVVVL